jgi:hypothetical protein
MFVSLTRVSTGDQPLDNATMVGEEMQRWLRDIDGFAGLLLISREGTTIGMTFWESREVAEAHLRARMQFLERMMAVAGAEIEEIVGYEVTYAELGRLAGGPG